MSDPTNPYAAPQASTLSATTDPALASPWLRLVASIVDGIVLFPINYILGRIFLNMPSLEAQTEAIKKGQDVNALMPGRGMILASQIVGIVVFLAVNFVFLKKGQTIGKLALKLQIQNRQTGTLLPVQDLIVKRVLPLYSVAALATAIHWSIGIILMVDLLCIFRPGRNTLHDDIANTKVVKLPG